MYHRNRLNVGKYAISHGNPMAIVTVRDFFREKLGHQVFEKRETWAMSSFGIEEGTKG